jgi:glycosyltransferase involved in cell wall biosynthesis
MRSVLEREESGESASVDVVVPCHQYGRYLRACVTSVLAQGIQDVRVLIVDNASTDDSVEVARQLAIEDHRVEVVARRSNLGPHASYNEGIDWACSKYFVVLDADDLLVPGCLAHAVALLEGHPGVGFAHGMACWVGPDDPIPVLKTGNEPWQIIAGAELLESFCRTARCHVQGPSTVVMRTEVQKRAGHYRSQLPHTDDFEMWMRLACFGSAAMTKAYSAIRRFHPSSRTISVSQTRSRDRASYCYPTWPWHDEEAFQCFFAHEGTLLPDASRLQRLVERNLGARAYWSALAQLCRGQVGIARDLWRFAFRRRPMTALLPPVGYLLHRDDMLQRTMAMAREVPIPRLRGGSSPAGSHDAV